LVALSLFRYLAFKLRLRALPTTRTESTTDRRSGASEAAVHTVSCRRLGTQGCRAA